MLRQALRIIVGALADLWENIYVLVFANLVWGLSLLPAAAIAFALPINGFLAFFLALIVLVILTGPTTIALYKMTQDPGRRERLEMAEFWSGLRTYYKRGWLLAGINAFFAFIASINLFFYNQPAFSNSPIRYMNILWIYLIVCWLLLQIYLWPFAIRMEPESKLRLGPLFRNTALALFKYLPISLIAGLFLIALLAIELLLLKAIPLLLFGLALQALISNRATRTVLNLEDLRLAKTEENALQPGKIDVPYNSTKLNDEVDKTQLPPGVTRRGG